jgi:hypothetical protein
VHGEIEVVHRTPSRVLISADCGEVDIPVGAAKSPFARHSSSVR